MVKAGRHVFVPSGVTDWHGDEVGCRDCPLPESNEIHQVRELDDEQRAAEKRRTGERE